MVVKIGKSQHKDGCLFVFRISGEFSEKEIKAPTGQTCGGSILQLVEEFASN